MSGICGFVNNNLGTSASPNILHSMVEALGIRDERQGDWVCYPEVGLGSLRVKGAQNGAVKMESNGSPLGMAFFGNLYWSVGEEKLGLRESTDPILSILQLYERVGMKFLSHLCGEFCLALWDGAQQALYLATDRFRTHPLFYYHDQNNLLVFGSRMKAILASQLLSNRSVDSRALVDFVARSYIPTPRTIFRDIKKIPPGHVLCFSNGTIKFDKYWDMNFLQPEFGSKKNLEKELRHVLQEAVRIRLAEDVKHGNVGTFLSGGVDSSTVTGILSQISTQPIKSFSIKFDEHRYNEVHYARIAAERFEVEHYEYTVTAQDCLNSLPILLDTFDEPYANASSIPTFFCSKLALENNVRFLYAGDGGDELFAGNERYALQRKFDYYGQLPKLFRDQLLSPLVNFLAEYGHLSLFIKGKKFIQRANIPYPQRLHSYGTFEVVPQADIFNDEFLSDCNNSEDLFDGLQSYYFQAAAKTELDRQLYIDLKRAISDNDLFKVTRMTEAAGVNVRFPFLDMNVAEFASKVPSSVKMRGTRLRSFFKDAYADFLPVDIRKKKKHGFGLPIAIWLKTNKTLNEMMNDLVLSQQSRQRGFFKPKALENMVENHKTDSTAFYGTLLWNFMVLELWFRTQLES